jgi:hypothetical protein
MAVAGPGVTRGAPAQVGRGRRARFACEPRQTVRMKLSTALAKRTELFPTVRFDYDGSFGPLLPEDLVDGMPLVLADLRLARATREVALGRQGGRPRRSRNCLKALVRSPDSYGCPNKKQGRAGPAISGCPLADRHDAQIPEDLAPAPGRWDRRPTAPDPYQATSLARANPQASRVRRHQARIEETRSPQ